MTTESSPISEREREILRLVATGATNQQIALQLNISVNTVKVHLRNIFGKIGAASRTEAIVYAMRTGLVEMQGHSETAASPIETPVALAENAAPILVLPEVGVFTPEPVEPLPHHASVEVVPAMSVVESATATSVATPVAAPAVAAPAAQARWRWLVFGLLGLGLLVVGTVLLMQRPQPPITSSPTPEVQTNRWRNRAPMLQPRNDFAVTAYDLDGKLYVIGGTAAGQPSATVERYDPANDVWTSLTDKPTPASHIQAVRVGGLLYVPGGEGAGGAVLTTFEAYDPRSQQWSSLPPLPQPRSRYGLAAIDGKIYLFGGWDGQSSRAEVFAYNPAASSWSEAAPMPTARRSAGAAVIAGRIYVIGGEEQGGPSRVNERFDPTNGAAGQWDRRTPLPTTIGTPGVVSDNNTLLVVVDPQQRTVLQYTPDTDAWETNQSTIPAEVHVSDRAAFFDRRVFVFGPSTGEQSSGVHEYEALYGSFLPNVSNGP